MENYFFDSSEEVKEETSKFLVFKVENEEYGLDIYNVVEIINIQPFTDIPDLPEHMAGIINLRDRVYPVMNLRSRFRKPLMEFSDRTCIILVEFSGLHLGIIVDDILEVADVPDSDIKVAPEEKTGFYNKFINRIVDRGDGRNLLIIDCDALFVNEKTYLEENFTNDQ